jgi:hypothetical protein
MACPLKSRTLIHNCSKVLLHPNEMCMMDPPNTDDLRDTVFYNSRPLVSNISIFNYFCFVTPVRSLRWPSLTFGKSKIACRRMRH